MSEMAKQAGNGTLNSFASIFSVTELSEQEREGLADLLESFAPEEGTKNAAKDLQELSALTMELKAITNQAAILHGERIKRAQQIFTQYRDGAFTAWLITTYGNRQTPYNFLMYYEFYQALPQPLRLRIENMPRQAIYTLASRDGELNKKQRIIEDYKGETKNELLALIRLKFPLANEDKRKADPVDAAIKELRKVCETLAEVDAESFSKKQKNTLKYLTNELLILLSAAQQQN
jgi:hypothetical protein